MPSEGAAPPPDAAGAALEVGGPRRLHLLSPVFFATGHARRLWPLALLLAARRLWWLLALGALVLLAWSALEWLRRTYTLEGGALRLEEGVLSRQLRAVPFDRIQQVDLVRKPLHRLLGVATLRVETAGGSSRAEVDLDVVTLAEARSLRSTLLQAKARAAGGPGAAGSGSAAGGAVDSRAHQGSGSATLPEGAPSTAGSGGARPGTGILSGGARPGTGILSGGARPDTGSLAAAEVEAAPPPERVLLRLRVGEVVLAGITGSRAAAALVVLGPLSQVTDWVPGLDDWLLARFDPESVTPTTPAAFLVVAVLVAVVWLGLAALSSIVTDYGFTLARVGDDLVVRRGLLERREAVLPLARLQVVRVEESLLRRALALASVRLQSAGRTGRGDETASRLAIPVLQRSEVNRVLGELLPGASPIPALRAPPPAARRRAVVRSVARTALAAAVVAVAIWLLATGNGFGVAPRFALLLLPLLALAVVAGLAAYRSLGHAAGPEFLYARSGVAIRVVTVVPVAKAQSGSVRSSLFQRRAGLATLHVDIAGGGPTPRVHDESQGRTETLLQVVLGRPVSA
jgi:putative membrane protein